MEPTWRVVAHASVLAALALGLPVAALAGKRILSSRAQSRAENRHGNEAPADHGHGFATLSKLASLEVLGLVDTGVEALPGVENLTRLRTLDLGSRAVTDAGLGRLVALPDLKELNPSDTSATDRSLAAIGAVRGLVVLRLDGTAVGDSGLRNLAGLEALRKIGLVDTRVTPEGLLALAALPKLREVEIGVPQAAMLRLKAAMPNCQITAWDR
ncbi:MAG: hypothetical protein L6Q95_05650 [Planctomycetes bacterium]|nr:hypothetical protein [Planctomycetota bacterium]